MSKLKVLLNKKQAFEISATVIISVFAVAAIVFGATTISTSVSTADVTATGAVTVSGLATLANATTSLETVTTLWPTNVYGFTLQGAIAGNSQNITALGKLTVTGTTATSTFATGGLTVGTNQFAVQQSSGKIGIGTTTFSSFITATGGTTGTTTVEFGDQYTTGSKTCFNVKTNVGASASFYVVGTGIIVEAKRCE